MARPPDRRLPAPAPPTAPAPPLAPGSFQQTSWLLFLEYLDGLEDDRAAVAALEGRAYTTILEASYRWSRWAAPNNASGQVDHHAGHCAKSSMGSMACACAPRRRSVSPRFSTKKRSSAWATPAATAVSTSRPGR
jgi:hypothetical protein